MSLGLNAYHASGDSSFAARVEYNAKAGRFYKVERTQDGNGMWATEKVDMTMKQPEFALDLGSIMVGFAYFPPGSPPSTMMVPFGSPMPNRESKDYKAGFLVKIYNPRDLGEEPREFMSTAGVVVAAVEELWEAFQASPDAAAGKIPVVKLVDVKPVQSKHGTNFAPVFAVQQYVDRSRAFGDRTVPAPGAKPAQAAPHAAPTNHVPPPHVTAAVPDNAQPATMPDSWN